MKPYYDRDGITIYNADCLDVLPLLDQVDHVITDPPYEVEAHTKARRSNPSAGSWRYDEYAIDFGAMDEATRSAVGYEMARLSRGWILVFCQVEAAMLWRDSLHPARYMRTQIWRKPDGAPQFTGDRPGMGYESIVTAWAGEGRSRWNGGGRHGVYDCPLESKNSPRSSTKHPTMKPIALMRELIELFTNPGDVILDPFMGSGTTLRAAKDLGRRAIGIEMSNEIGEDGVDRRYCDIAVARLAQEVLAL